MCGSTFCLFIVDFKNTLAGIFDKKIASMQLSRKAERHFSTQIDKREKTNSQFKLFWAHFFLFN